MQHIDLNADVGESFGPYVIGDDERMLPHVTSANVAWRVSRRRPVGHAPHLRLAAACGASPGAHPGYADLMGFGRRDVAMDPRELEDLVVYQIGALAGAAAAEGTRLRHVKPPRRAVQPGGPRPAAGRRHSAGGARGRRRADPLRGLGVLPRRGRRGPRPADRGRGVRDRAYRADGALVPRREPGAVITDPAVVAERALRLVRHGEVAAVNGEVIRLRRDTICLHGDTPGAADLAAALRARLEEAGVRLAPVGAGGPAGAEP